MALQTESWVGNVVLAERYQIVKELGRGGMAEVFRAQDRRLKCDVVVKVPQAELLSEPDFRKRFAREIASLVRLSHPHIMRVIDAGEHDGRPYAVLQHLSGGDLRQRMSKNTERGNVELQLRDLRSWLPQIASALDFIHRQNFVHRDVKPDNILFDGAGHPFLSDFGIAKVLSANEDTKVTTITRHGAIVGTPLYMAPELILGKPIDGRVDQFALAVTVYEILSGHYPFEGATLTAIFENQKKTPVRLDKLLPGISAATAGAVEQALQKTPGKRFDSCAAFAEAVLNSSPSANIPAPSPIEKPDTSKVFCPGCGDRISILMTAQGKRVRCPKCQFKFQSPVVDQPTLPAALPYLPRDVKSPADTGDELRLDTVRHGKPPSLSSWVGTFMVVLLILFTLVFLLFLVGRQ